MNYVASVVFGALAITLLFAFSWSTGSVLSMKLCVATAGAAWTACFLNYVLEHTSHLENISWFLAAFVYVFNAIAITSAVGAMIATN